MGACRGPGPHVLNLDDDGPTSPLCIVPHCRELQGQRLLVVSGNPSVEPGAERFSHVQKTPANRGSEHSVFSGVWACDDGMFENYNLFT